MGLGMDPQEPGLGGASLTGCRQKPLWPHHASMTPTSHVHVGGFSFLVPSTFPGKEVGEEWGELVPNAQSARLTAFPRLTQLLLTLATLFFQTFYFEVRLTEKFWE